MNGSGFWTFRRVILDNEVQSSDDATKVVKLPLSNYLHTLYIKVKCTNGATSAKGQSIADVVDLIEVVANGSDVIVSLTPNEIKRWALWQTGLSIPQNRSEVAAAVQEMVFPVQFGRSPFDPDYYLPCARLSDLELRIKYSPTIAATSFVTGTTTIGVFGVMSMGAEPGVYRGTLSTKTAKAFVAAASGDDQTYLPKGNLLRQVLIYAYEAGTEDGGAITRVKLDLNNGERELFNIAWNDLSDMNTYENWVNHTENIRAVLADTDTLATGVARIGVVNVSENVAGVVATDDIYFRRVTAIAGDTLTIEGTKSHTTAGAEDLTADATGRNTYVSVQGRGLSHAVVLDLSGAGESALLNTSNYDQIRLTLTQGNAGGVVRVSTQEVRQVG
jgi:hypothetical protein